MWGVFCLFVFVLNTSDQQAATETLTMPSSLANEPSRRTYGKGMGFKAHKPLSFQPFRTATVHTKDSFAVFRPLSIGLRLLTHLLDTTIQLQKNCDLLFLLVWIEFMC